MRLPVLFLRTIIFLEDYSVVFNVTYLLSNSFSLVHPVRSIWLILAITADFFGCRGRDGILCRFGVFSAMKVRYL